MADLVIDSDDNKQPKLLLDKLMTCSGCSTNINLAESLPVVLRYGALNVKCPICGVYNELDVPAMDPNVKYLVAEE